MKLRTSSPARWTGSLALAFLAMALAGIWGCDTPAPDSDALNHRPVSLVLISLDTVRADRLGSYGYEPANTPNLDRLASEGIRFEEVTATAPLTLPSHASLLSGLLPLQHGLRLNGQGRFPDHLGTLATHLEAADYQTGAFVGAFVLDRRFGLDRGFAHYGDAIERSRDGQIRLEAERPAEQVIDSTLAWLDQLADDRPFFAWVHLYDAHAPYAPPEPFAALHADRPYDGEIAYVDAQVGRLLEALRPRDPQGHTVIAVVGDHGEALGQHGEASHGLLLYEPTLRVPWLLRAPGLASGGSISTPVSLIDVAPTLAALVGLPFEPSGQATLKGRDLSATLLSGTEIEPVDLYAESAYPATFGWSALASLRQGNLKHIAGGRPEFYDLAADPGEEQDLSDERRRDWRAFADRLRALESTAVEPAADLDADDETRARLAALGYVAGQPSSSLARPGQGADPTARIEAFRQWEIAQSDLESGRPDRAVQTLQTLVAEDPKNPIFRSSLATAWRRLGQLDRAIDLYRQTVASQEQDPAAWYDLASALKDAGRHREAIEAGREALRRDPNRPEGLNLLGISYLEEGDLERAREHFELALELDPRDATAHNNLANVHRAAGRPELAETSYRRASELLPNYPDPWNGLGTLAVEAGRGAEAVELFGRALQLAPEFHEARLNRGIAYELSQRSEQASADYRALLAQTDLPPRLRQATETLLRRLENR